LGQADQLLIISIVYATKYRQQFNAELIATSRFPAAQSLLRHKEVMLRRLCSEQQLITKG